MGETRRRHDHDAGVNLTNGLFGLRRILLLDDALYLAGGVANDAAIAARIGEIDGEDGQAVLASLEQALQGHRRGQRHIAVEDQRLGRRAEFGQGLGDGMAGPQLLRLFGPGQVGRGQRRLDDIATMAIDDDQLFRGQRARRVDDVLGQCLAGHRSAPWVDWNACACLDRQRE